MCVHVRVYVFVCVCVCVCVCAYAWSYLYVHVMSLFSFVFDIHSFFFESYVCFCHEFDEIRVAVIHYRGIISCVFYHFSTLTIID